MRWLLAVLVLVPLASAQAPAVELATLTADAFPSEVEPLKSPITTTLHLRASCALADGPQGVLVTYVVAEAPSWATTLLSPATDALDPVRCEEGWLEATVQLTVTASDQAPAFAATPIVVEAIVGSGAREQRVSAQVALSASYFSILDVQVAEPQAVVAPGGTHDFVVRFTNFGNGPTRVESQLVEVGEGIQVQLPAPVTLESKQSGGERISEDVVFRARADDADGFVNRVALVSVRVVSAYATDDSFPGDESSVSFLVTVRSGGERSQGLAEAAENIPASPSLALAALTLLGLLARRPLRR